MQASQRTEYNYALEYAILQANLRKKPLVVFFGLTDRYPQANLRHYKFMLEGLREVQKELSDRGISFIIKFVSPEIGVLELAKRALIVIVDRGYTKIQRYWRNYVAQRIGCPLIQVEGDVVVPVEVTSEKEEYSAYTIRRKIKGYLDYFLNQMDSIELKKKSIGIVDIESEPLDEKVILKKLNIEDISPSIYYRGGTSEAKKLLEDFLEKKIDYYPKYRNDPSKDYLSHMSPYLHFGQISPVYIALRVLETGSHGMEAYLEELIVRRELAINFVYYNPDYDRFNSLPKWAIDTLKEHSDDKRKYLYTLEELEDAKTHDKYWNSAQKELLITGKMHSYIRMYWGKKVIEWSKTPEEAFERLIYLNNKYALDGRDPNSYAGIAWCFGKHDRPWKERSIFGKIRYMSEKSLENKFDMISYIEKIDKLQGLAYERFS